MKLTILLMMLGLSFPALSCEHYEEDKARIEEEIDVLEDDIRRLNEEINEITREQLACYEESKSQEENSDDQMSDHQSHE